MSITKVLKSALSGSRSATQRAAMGITQIRDLRLRLVDQRDEVSRRATPREEAIAAMDRDLARQIEVATDQINLSSLLRPGGPGPALHLDLSSHALPGLLAAANLGGLREVLIGMIDADLDGVTTMSREDKDRELKRIDTEILDAELAEEAMIRDAERAGLTALRRGDADPRAVLAADSELPA